MSRSDEEMLLNLLLNLWATERAFVGKERLSQSY